LLLLTCCSCPVHHELVAPHSTRNKRSSTPASATENETMLSNTLVGWTAVLRWTSRVPAVEVFGSEMSSAAAGVAFETMYLQYGQGK
jgi:hypothetical protein